VLSILIFVILLLVYTRHFTVGLLTHAAVTMLYLHRLIYGERTFINPVSWSLEIEVQFYILAPVFMQLYRLRGKLFRRAMIASLLIGISIVQFAIVDSPRASESILFYAQFFFMGLLIADIYIVDGNRIRPSLFCDGAGILGLAFTFCAPRTYFTSQVVLPWAMALLFISALRGVVLRRFFASPWVAAIGGMCYSIYLMHFQMIAVSFKLTNKCIVPHLDFLANYVIQLLVTGIPVMAVSLAFYLLIERPCMDPKWPSKFWHWITGRSRSEARAFDSDGIQA
jgi:peptidoglycan/LPS O-acetylase OafA/YrhL